MELIALERIVERESVIDEARKVSKSTGREYFAQEILGIDAKYFSKILSGKNKLSWKMIERIRDRLKRVRQVSVN